METKLTISHVESELLARLREGEVAAFTELYEAFAERLITYAYNILEDREASLDMVQDVMLWIWMNRGTLAISTSIEAYLFTATRNGVFGLIRKEKTRSHVFDEIEKRIWGEPVVENLAQQRELQQKINEAIEALPKGARDIYRLSREEHMSHQQIADVLGISPKTVDNQLGKALKRIRASLGDFLPILLLFLGGK